MSKNSADAVDQKIYELNGLAMFTGENKKKSLDNPTGILRGKQKIGSDRVETKRTAFPAISSNTGNFLFIEADLLPQAEKNNVQLLATDDNTQGTLSCIAESADRNNISQKYLLIKDAQIFNSKPSPEQGEQKENTAIQNLLTEITSKSLYENEMLSLFEQCKDNRLNVKEDTVIDSNKKNPFLMGDLQAPSSPKKGADDYINSGFRINRFMIFQEDGGNNIYIPSDRLSFTDAGSLSLPEAFAEGEQFTQNEGHSVAAAAPRQLFLRIVQPRIDTVPYLRGEEGTDNMGLQEKSRIINPKDFSLPEIEEIVLPTAETSLRSAIRELSSLVQDLLRKEGSTEKEHVKKESPDAHITESGGPLTLLENKNRNENSPLRVQILQEPPKAESFVLPKKGDASIEVSLEPEGFGKIDIELTLDRGIVNAQINTSEIISKEMIERNLHAILSSLIDEGLNIGNFSVSLRNRQGNMSESNRKEALKTLPAVKEVRFSVRLADSRLINIFV